MLALAAFCGYTVGSLQVLFVWDSSSLWVEFLAKFGVLYFDWTLLYFVLSNTVFIFSTVGSLWLLGHCIWAIDYRDVGREQLWRELILTVQTVMAYAFAFRAVFLLDLFTVELSVPQTLLSFCVNNISFAFTFSVSHWAW